jgi:dienelactone hydrolase
MVRILLAGWLVLGLPGLAGAEDRVLFIGNSFTFADGDKGVDHAREIGGVPGIFRRLAEAGGQGSPIVEMQAAGGKDYRFHCTNAATQAALRSRVWTHVVLQNYSTEPTHFVDGAHSISNHLKYGEELYRRVLSNSPQAQVILEETWSRAAAHPYISGVASPRSFVSTQAMQQEIRSHYLALARRLDAIRETGPRVLIAPVGDAWEAAGGLLPASSPGFVNLFKSDRYHGNDNGYYLAAAVLYSRIYRANPHGLSSHPQVAALKLHLTVAPTQLEDAAWNSVLAAESTDASRGKIGEGEKSQSNWPSTNLVLPDALVTLDGQKVTSPELWRSRRRAEVLELFRTNVYGRAPVGRPAQLKFEVAETNANAMDGRAVGKQVTISYQGPGGEGAIHLVLFVPRGTKAPAPCFLLICNRGKGNIDPSRARKSPFWPAESLIARGYAAAAFYNGEVVPDKPDGMDEGVFRIFNPAGQRQGDNWGAIAAWAWGASRAMDYLETDPDIDSRHVAVVGHSRGGKTALWAGAEDERFAMAVSNDSGSTGAALARNKRGERIHDINRVFPHWFCQNYKAFNDREPELPVDQHMLAALIAPRLLYIASATEDAWSDPGNEFLSAVHAEPVYRLFGRTGLGSLTMPSPERPLQDGQIGYHLRTGAHDLTEYDWARFMDFADAHFGVGAKSKN